MDDERKAPEKRRGGAALKASVAAALCLPAAAYVADLARTAAPYVSGAEAAASLSEYAEPAPAEAGAAEAGPDAGGGGNAAAAPEIDWEGLRAANADVVAWVDVPGTRVSYPLVQADPGDPQRWLRRDFYGSENWHGCPYVDSALAGAGGIDAPLVTAYGHSLMNGLMFSDFQRYSDAAFAEAHRRLTVSTPEGVRELEVFAADVVDADVESISTSFESAAAAHAYVSRRAAESDVSLGDPPEGARVWCFVTCSYETDNSRTLVYAAES